MSKYTTRDLKREVDRLNKKYKKTNRTAIKFVFGKDQKSGDYYIATKSNLKESQWSRNNIWPHSESSDVGKIVEDVRSKSFGMRNDWIIRRTHDFAMEDIENARQRNLEEKIEKLKTKQKKRKSKYIK